MTFLRALLKKTAAWCLVGVIVVGPIKFGLMPYLQELNFLQSSIKAKQELVGRLQSSNIMLIAKLADQVRFLDHLEQSGVLFSSKSPDENITMRIREILVEATSDSGGRLKNSQTLVSQPVGALVEHSVQGSISSTAPQLISLLYNLEVLTPFVFVKQIQIGASPVEEITGPTLSVQLRIVGYALAEEQQ